MLPLPSAISPTHSVASIVPIAWPTSPAPPLPFVLAEMFGDSVLAPSVPFLPPSIAIL